MYESNGIVVTDGGTTSQLSDMLDALPQEARLDSGAGKDKAAVMRRHVAGRKKPTRQGLRDSLLKSLDESDLQSILADVTIAEEGETDNSVPEVTPSPPVRAQNFKNPLMASLNTDLTNVLRRRQSDQSDGSQTKVVKARPVTLPAYTELSTSTNNTVNSYEQTTIQELSPPIDRTSKPKIEDCVPDVVPRRKLPDLTIGVNREETTTRMETSPELKTFPLPYLKPKLKPTPVQSKPSTDTEEPVNPWTNRLNKVQPPPDKELPSRDAEEQPKAPWTPKLRKVEFPTKPVVSPEEVAPKLPPRVKPKPRPMSLGNYTVHEQKLDNSSNLVIQKEKVSVASLPTKSLQSPSSTQHSQLHQQPVAKENTTSNSEEPCKPWETSLKPVADIPKMRRPKATTANSQPDWIRQAAEKRKRASLLIEQAEAMDNLSKVDSNVEQNKEPFVQLRSPNRISRGFSRSSSTDSSSTSSSQQSEVTVPAWKRELTHQNSQRRMERRRKVQSCIEPAISLTDLGKENRDDCSGLAWKRDLKGFSNRGSVIDLREIEEGDDGAEPEFIRLFKKRQERLRRCGSQLLEPDE